MGIINEIAFKNYQNHSKVLSFFKDFAVSQLTKKLPNEPAFPNVQKYICAVKDLICEYVLGIRAVFCKVLKSIILFLVSNTPQKLQNR